MKSEYSQFRDRVVDIFTSLHQLTVKAGKEDLEAVAARLLANVNAPFLFVVVGEVKSGKSSFINALLGADVCAVAPDPCTDEIQRITHSEAEGVGEESGLVREIGLEHDILREVAIVDTPGTNSIMEHHQEVTEGFIPESDLVIFVFPALNPYSATAWEFFKFVHERWLKKIVFVLQQADRVTEEELSTNITRVEELARERQIEDPVVFPVSAKKAMAGEPDSGMDAVWDYIRSTVTGGRHYLLKMRSLLDTAGRVMDDIAKGIDEEREALDRDRAEQQRIEAHLVRGRKSTLREVDALKARLVRAYDRISGEITDEFEQGLSVPSLLRNTFAGFLGRRNALKEWMEELDRRFTERFTEKSAAIVKQSTRSIAENIVAMLESMRDELEAGRREDRGRFTIPTIGESRFDVLDDVIANVGTLLSDQTMGTRLEASGIRKIGDRAVMGGFITAIGAVLLATTHMAFFDVTGGIFTTLGAFLAVNTLVFKRGSIMKKFRKGFADGLEQFEEELDERLSGQVEAIYSELELAFEPLSRNIGEREEQLESMSRKAREVAEAIEREHEATDRLAE